MINNINVGKIGAYTEHPGMAVFEFYGNSKLFTGTHMTVSYTPIPSKGWTISCLHSEEVSWEI